MREEELNCEVLQEPPKKSEEGAYLRRSDEEAKNLIETSLGVSQPAQLYIIIATKFPTDALKALAYAHGLKPKAVQIPI